MKKLNTWVLLMLCVAMLVGMLSGCAKTAPAAEAPAAEAPAAEAPAAEEAPKAAEETEIEIWYSNVPDTEKDLPEEEWLINRYARQFEELNPGVKIKVVYNADQAVMQSKLKAAVMAGTAPDIANLYSGLPVTSFKDILTDISAYIPAEDRELLVGWETVSENMDVNAACYGYPASGTELGIFLYNKELAAQAGVDLEGEGSPKNAEEFKAALQKMQDAGLQPILGGGEALNELWIWGVGAWWPQMSGTARVVSNNLGTTKYADDQGFIDTLGFTASLFEAGFVNADYATNKDAINRFYNGEGVMFPTGNWMIAAAEEVMGDNVGIYVVPSFDGKAEALTLGGVGQALVVLNSCEAPDIATKFLSFISQKDYVIDQAKATGKVPQRKDVSAEELDWAGKPNYEKMLEACKSAVLWCDNNLQADVAGEYYARTMSVVVGDMTVADCAALFDQMVEDAAE